MNKFIKINAEDRNRVVELIEQEKDIDFSIYCSIKDMIRLENNYHVSECGNYILNETIIYDDEEQLIESDTNVIKIENGIVSMYEDQLSLNDICDNWKKINE